jgi:hypothetical protein
MPGWGEFDQTAFNGKTIESASCKVDPGDDDMLTIKFTDGSSVVVQAIGCNDDTGALSFHPKRS